MAYEDSFSFGTDIEDIFLDGNYTSPAPSSSTSSSFMSSAPTFLKAGGDLLGGIGAYMQGQDSASADEYNARLALIEGDFQVQQLSRDEDLTLSTQKAMYAKAGVEHSGSVLDTALSTATNYEYSKQVSNFNSQSKANMYDYEAQVAKQKGKFALGMGALQAGMDLLPLALL